MNTTLIILLVYRLILWGGCVFLIWNGWSVWWILVAAILTVYYDGEVR